jgi:sulfatase modifying factor 1
MRSAWCVVSKMRQTLPITLSVIFLFLLAATALAQPPTPVLPTATPTPTPPPVMVVVQATPIPQPEGDLLTEFWQQYKYTVIMALVGALLIGVLLQRISEKLVEWAGRAVDKLGRRFANWAYFRRHHWQNYVATLNAKTQEWQSLRGVEFRMDDIYVEVQLTDLPAIYTHADSTADWEQTRHIRRRGRPFEPRQAVADFRRLAVIGEPGAGKTTLLRWLAWLYANERAETPSPPRWLSRLFTRRDNLLASRSGVEAHAMERPALPRWLDWLTPIGRVPVYLELKDLQDVTNLADHLPKYFESCGWPNASDFIRDTLDKGTFLLLLDALDEVDDPAKLPPLVKMVCHFADRYSNDRHPNWIVLSSRPQSYKSCEAALDFKTVEVLEFTPQQIRDFLRNWFRDDDPSLAQTLWSHLEADDRLLELAANPLLLTFITQTYHQTRNLETQYRAELFGQIVTVRMEEWDNIRKVWRGFSFTRPKKERFLRGTALHLNTQPRSLPRSQLLEDIRQFLRDDGQVDPEAPHPDPRHDTQADRFLWEIAEGSGLLHERAIARYDFSHKTLREYFAAAELKDLPDGEAQLLHHLQVNDFDHWEMVAVLYAGLCSDASAFIRDLCGRNPALTADGLLLAARCLRDAASVAADPALRDDLSSTIVAALPATDPATQNEAISLLRALHPVRSDRLVAHARRLTDSGHPALAAHLLPDVPEAETLRLDLSQRLLDTLQTGDAPAREAAMAALTIVGGAPEVAAPLLRDLEADDPSLRAEAARALAALGLPDQIVLDALHTCHQADSNLDVRAAAASALLQLGRAEELGMVHVPAGEFLMGTPLERAHQLAVEYGYIETNFDNETPQRVVQLPNYWMTRTPVTNAQYKQFLDANPDHRIPYVDEVWAKPYNWDREKHTHPEGLADHPVVLVSWDDAVAYTRWAGMRLPTEAEWEKAARGGLQIRSEDNPYPDRLWPWGNEWDREKCNSAETWTSQPLKTHKEWRAWWDDAWTKKLQGKQVQTKPVGAYPAGTSPYGLLDIAGNVWEWTADWLQGYPGTTYKSDNFGQKYRVLRGGSWRDYRNGARVVIRNGYGPGDRSIDIGFRCVSNLP